MGGKLDIVVVCLIGITTLSSGEKDSREKRSQLNGIPREYCESQTFKAKCWRNEVIMMQSALYGRMKIGRCVEADLGYLGCHADVLNLVDKMCSGKQECQIRVPDEVLDATKPCYKELKVYLEASYTCVRVVNNEQNVCRASTSAQMVSSAEHVSSNNTNKAGCGHRNNPWFLEAQPGQKLNLTLVDFDWATRGGEKEQRSLARTPACVPYGYILEKGKDGALKKNVSICGGKERVKPLHVTAGHSVQFYSNQRENYNYLIKFEAVGCPDLRRPKDAWIERNEDEAVVGCDATRQTWHLKCQGRQWVGVIGNCTQHLVAAVKEGRHGMEEGPIPHGVAIVIIVGVAIIICIIIVCIGVVCIKRYTKRPVKKPNSEIKYDGVKQADEDTMKSQKSRYGPPKQISADQRSIHSYSKRNDYQHIFDMPLPEPGSKIGTHGITEQAPYVVYGGSGRNHGHRADDNYNMSIASKDDSRYYVLDRDALTGCIPEDPDC